jgi:adenylate cyclase
MSEERGSRAREAGAATFAALRRATARKVADMIRSDPDDAAAALEMGLVDRQWLESPGEGPISSSTPTDILRRFLERSVERKPSQLNSLGLTAVQLLSSGGGDGSGTGKGQVVTVVFTDLEGFTAFTDEQGDAAAIAVIAEHHRLAGPVVRRWGGKLVKHLGDGLLCTFPAPESGVRAALDLLGTAPPPLRLRAGVHTGEAVVTRNDVLGHVVNVAARVCEAARGGQVLASADVCAALGDEGGKDGDASRGGLPGIRLGKVKSRRMKGVKTPVGVCEVTTTSPPAASAGA